MGGGPTVSIGKLGKCLRLHRGSYLAANGRSFGMQAIVCPPALKLPPAAPTTSWGSLDIDAQDVVPHMLIPSPGV